MGWKYGWKSLERILAPPFVVEGRRLRVWTKSGQMCGRSNELKCRDERKTTHGGIGAQTASEHSEIDGISNLRSDWDKRVVKKDGCRAYVYNPYLVTFIKVSA